MKNCRKSYIQSYLNDMGMQFLAKNFFHKDAIANNQSDFNLWGVSMDYPITLLNKVTSFWLKFGNLAVFKYSIF